MDALTSQMLDLLRVALKRPEQRREALASFERIVLDSDPPEGAEDTWDVLDGLALDLAYYVPNPAQRWQDAAYFGDEELERRLRAALAAVDALRGTKEASPEDSAVGD
jgi:hypothetical protein